MGVGVTTAWHLAVGSLEQHEGWLTILLKTGLRWEAQMHRSKWEIQSGLGKVDFTLLRIMSKSNAVKGVRLNSDLSLAFCVANLIASVE